MVLAALLEVQSSPWFRMNRSFVCGPFAEIVEALSKEEFGERPVWLGTSEGVNTVLLVNPTKSSWTIVTYQREIGCVIGAGSASQAFDPKLDNSKP